jgi:anti-anti-sigma factor
MPAKVENTGEVARIVLTGDLDFSMQDSLGKAITQALQMNTAKEIQVDMAAVTFIDSSVIRALLHLQEAARSQGKSFSIWNCNSQIRETFTIGGFDQLFIIH